MKILLRPAAGALESNLAEAVPTALVQSRRLGCRCCLSCVSHAQTRGRGRISRVSALVDKWFFRSEKPSTKNQTGAAAPPQGHSQLRARQPPLLRQGPRRLAPGNTHRGSPFALETLRAISSSSVILQLHTDVFPPLRPNPTRDEESNPDLRAASFCCVLCLPPGSPACTVPSRV